MSEPQHEPQAGPVVKVARDLTAITDMADDLFAQAVHSAGDPDVPGGKAMVWLAGVANPRDYLEQVDYLELHHYTDPLRYALPDLVHDDDDTQAVLQRLWYWSEDLRTIHEQDLGKRRPTIASEANMIRWALGWMWDNEIHWNDFADDMAQARREMEDILKAGDRVERIRVVCPDCEAGRPLILRYGDDADADRWKCPVCRHVFDVDQVAKARAKQLRSQGAQRWVPVKDVISVMRTQGWQERTVRGWLDVDIEVLCDSNDRRCAAWWPDVWRAHLTAKYRREMARRRAVELTIRKAICIEEHGEDCWVKGRGCDVTPNVVAV